MAEQTMNVQQYLDDIEKNIPQELREMYQKMILSANRIMFDKSSHSEAMKVLEGPEPMEQKIAKGVTTIIYIIWQKSNGSVPPQLLIPVTIAVVLYAFKFLQDSGDESAQPAMLGQAIELAYDTVLRKFEIDPERVPQMVQEIQGGAAAPAEKPKAGGLMSEEA